MLWYDMTWGRIESGLRVFDSQPKGSWFDPLCLQPTSRHGTPLSDPKRHASEITVSGPLNVYISMSCHEYRGRHLYPWHLMILQESTDRHVPVPCPALRLSTPNTRYRSAGSRVKTVHNCWCILINNACWIKEAFIEATMAHHLSVR